MKINAGRFSVILQRLLGTSELNLLDELSPEVSPVLVLESDRPEWAFLSNQRLGVVAMNQAGVAAQVTNFRLRNPPSSGVLARVTRIRVMGEPTTDIAYEGLMTMGVATTDYATGGTESSRDSRLLTGTALIASSDNNQAAVGTTIDTFSGRWGTPNELVLPNQDDLIMLPGSHIDVRLSVAVTGFVKIAWREREIGRYELR